MIFEKMAAVLTITAIFFLLLLNSQLLFAGNRQPMHFGETPPKTHPLDLLIEDYFKKTKIKNFTIDLSNAAQYGDGSFLHTASVRFFSRLKREKGEAVEHDFSYAVERSTYVHNHIPQIRPYLDHFPVTSSNINVYLYYEPTPKRYYKPPFFCFAALRASNKKLELYKWSNPNAPSVLSQPLFLEKKIEDIPGLNNLLNISVPREKMRVSPIFVDQIMKHIGQEFSEKHHYPVLVTLQKKFDLHLSALRDTAMSRDPYREIASGFWTQNRNMELDEAKKFAETFAEEYLQELKKNRVVEKKSQKTDPVREQIKENFNWFCFRITFWDEHLNRVEEPYIAQIQCQDGKIHYFAADEGQRLYQVFEEHIPDRFLFKKARAGY